MLGKYCTKYYGHEVTPKVHLHLAILFVITFKKNNTLYKLNIFPMFRNYPFSSMFQAVRSALFKFKIIF